MNQAIQHFLDQHQLSSNYLETASQWFDPLIEEIASKAKIYNTEYQSAFILGICGAQGSGKSTLTDYCKTILNERFKLSTVCCSIDDFYLTKAERLELAKNIHPLLTTRGVPGTHDITLAIETLTALKQSSQDESTTIEIPVFNKAVDDRSEKPQKVSQKVDVIIFEGWCVNTKPQSPDLLTQAINELEREHDTNAIWRTYINDKLRAEYSRLFNLINYSVLLKAPSFDCVFKWRLEQEEKLAARLKNAGEEKLSGIMDRNKIKVFIQHYQRLTEHILLNQAAYTNCVFLMDENRNIVKHINNVI